MVQDLIVGLIVIASALYAFWILMPARLRRTGAAGLASLARRCGLGEQESQRLRTTLATHSSCGQCDSCKGCATAVANKPTGATPQPGVHANTEQARSG
jgi:hypothetical protein